MEDVALVAGTQQNLSNLYSLDNYGPKGLVKVENSKKAFSLLKVIVKYHNNFASIP